MGYGQHAILRKRMVVIVLSQVISGMFVGINTYYLVALYTNAGTYIFGLRRCKIRMILPSEHIHAYTTKKHDKKREA